MSKAIESISRRAAIINMAGAIVAPIAPAEGAEPDPIFALITELRRLEALSAAADARAKACRQSIDDDCTGCGKWIPFHADHPALKPMHDWLVAQNAERRGSFFQETLRVDRDDIERFNAQVGPEHEAQNKARLAWYDGRIAERQHKADVSGYTEASDEADALVDPLCDAERAVCQAIPTTVHGALAQIAVALEIKEVNSTVDGECYLNMDDEALINAFGALKRLLPFVDLEREGAAA